MPLAGLYPTPSTTRNLWVGSTYIRTAATNNRGSSSGLPLRLPSYYELHTLLITTIYAGTSWLVTHCLTVVCVPLSTPLVCSTRQSRRVSRQICLVR